ncbi:hypothetical protein ACVWZV_004218 [Bradyrhizobium sp. GM5.1]
MTDGTWNGFPAPMRMPVAPQKDRIDLLLSENRDNLAR